MDEEDIYEHLAHFGVKGMRWGQRKKQLTTKELAEQKNKRAMIRGSIAIGAILAIHGGAILAVKKMG